MELISLECKRSSKLSFDRRPVKRRDPANTKSGRISFERNPEEENTKESRKRKDRDGRPDGMDYFCIM